MNRSGSLGIWESNRLSVALVNKQYRALWYKPATLDRISTKVQRHPLGLQFKYKLRFSE